MHSIYIHIPFCNYKCDYCNFFVIGKDHPNFQNNLIQEYLTALHKEIDLRKDKSNSTQVKTIYFGGGTPALIGFAAIKSIIDHIGQVRSLEYLEELSIELNPDPFDETLDLVKQIGQAYKDFPRIRFSRGLQTFDDTILQLAGRNYNFNNLKGYLRKLQTIKQATMCYNFDFIAFGTLNNNTAHTQGGSSWNKNKLQFFQDMVDSHVADSFSLYMLELFPGSKREKLGHDSTQQHMSNTLKQCVQPQDDNILQEHQILSDSILSAAYKRYEVSNFALSGKNSIHNSVYRTLQPYIGLGASASGMLYSNMLTDSDYFGSTDISSNKGIRYTNTTNIMEYIQGKYVDEKKTNFLQESDILYETFMLGLRSYGISDIQKFTTVLAPNYEEKLALFEEEELIIRNGNHIKLSYQGLNVANRIIGELLR